MTCDSGNSDVPTKHWIPGTPGARRGQKTSTPKDSEGNMALCAILIEDLWPTELEEDICLFKPLLMFLMLL